MVLPFIFLQKNVDFFWTLHEHYIAHATILYFFATHFYISRGQWCTAELDCFAGKAYHACWGHSDVWLAISTSTFYLCTTVGTIRMWSTIVGSANFGRIKYFTYPSPTPPPQSITITSRCMFRCLIA